MTATIRGDQELKANRDGATGDHVGRRDATRRDEVGIDYMRWVMISSKAPQDHRGAGRARAAAGMMPARTCTCRSPVIDDYATRLAPLAGSAQLFEDYEGERIDHVDSR